jgi:hypothetical protein
LRLDPKDWSRQELLDRLKRFARFVQDKKTGSGELVVENKRLMTEDVAIILELCNRNTEIRVVKILNCGMNDEVFAQICGGLKLMRQITELVLVQNLLSSISVDLLISIFSKAVRKIGILNLKGNPLTFEDGEKLLNAFFETKIINEIDIELIKNGSTKGIIDLYGSGVRPSELGVLSALLISVDHVHTLKFGRCGINAQTLTTLVEVIGERHQIINLDLSSNSLNNDDTDSSGVDKLVLFVQLSSQLRYINVDNCGLPPEIVSVIQHSMMVNRSLYALNDGYHFNKFVKSIIDKTAKPPVISKLADWQPTITEIDDVFVRKNQLPLRKVVVHDNKIVLSTERPKKEYKFEF